MIAETNPNSDMFQTLCLQDWKWRKELNRLGLRCSLCQLSGSWMRQRTRISSWKWCIFGCIIRLMTQKFAKDLNWDGGATVSEQMRWDLGQSQERGKETETALISQGLSSWICELLKTPAPSVMSWSIFSNWHFWMQRLFVEQHH